MARFDRAIELHATLKRCYYSRAYARRKVGNLEGAVADLSELLRLDPRNREAHGLRGICRFDLGLLAEAEADYEEAMRRQPDQAHHRANRDECRAARREQRHEEERQRAAAFVGTEGAGAALELEDPTGGAIASGNNGSIFLARFADAAALGGASQARTSAPGRQVA